MPPPAAVKPSHGPAAKWTPRPYCSHSAHLLHPPLSSSPSLSPDPHLLSLGKWALRIHSAPQIKSYYIVIFHLHFVSPSLCVLLTLSFSYPSLPLPFPSSCLTLSLPCPSQKKGIWWDERCAEGWGVFHIPIGCNPMRSAGHFGLQRQRQPAPRCDLSVLYLCGTFCSQSHPQEENPFHDGSIWCCIT